MNCYFDEEIRENMELAGISRSKEFSPNNTGNDSEIFHLTMEKLIAKGCQIKEYSEEEFITRDLTHRYYFGMYRDKRSVEKMKNLEQNGCICINTAEGIERCYRDNLTQTMITHHVPYPKSKIVATNRDATSAIEELGGRNIWVKRGDFHAVHKEDVSFCRNSEEGNSLLHEFALRNIKTASLSSHLEGDLIKFYGVVGSDFFYWFYPYESHHSKFNQESVNGASRHYSFHEESFQFICQQAAVCIGIEIYGGDAIISPEGEIHLIDINDWPSFAPCREKASDAIAECIYKHFCQRQ